MRIGINALYLIPGHVGGTEIYLRCLLRALAEIDSANEYFIFTNRETDAGLVPTAANFHQEPQPVRAAIRPARILWEQTGLPLACVRRKLDVLLNPGFTAPVYAPCPGVTVFHDLQHKRHPEYFRWFDLPAWRALLFASAHLSRFVLADSEATRADVLRYYRLPENQVRLAPLGVDPAFFGLPRHPESFLLAVSTSHPHKNLDRLMAAFAEFRRRRPEFRLVITGVKGFVAEPLAQARASLGLEDAVEFTGWIPRADLYELFSRAWAFVYPSLFEGFGLPVLEALAAGVPSACSAIEPLRSLAGDAALQFDPQDSAAIREALERLVCDEPLRARLGEAGPRRAAGFSWQRTARLTLAALQDTQ